MVSILGYSQGVGNYNVSMNITGLNVKVATSANCGSRLESWLNYSNAGENSFFLSTCW